ncbi:MAG TPA: glycosyl hydrolase family 28 protein [Opitutaceae bacterium]|nr:glycosyl hydrolase family 28 protein [Opitutaceae bacterium]
MADPNVLSRRKWLGTVSASTLAATLGVAAQPGLPAAEPAATADRDRGARVYNIRDYGAKGDGTTLDTGALQAAVDACARDGGGTVLVPAGTFVIGTTELRSNVTLHVAAGGTLLGSGHGADYHAVGAIPLHGDSTLADGNWALLFAVDARNITLEGPGTIDGQGHLFHRAAAGVPPPSGLEGAHRPYHVLLYRCEQVVVRDLELVRGAFHSIRIIQSRRVRLDGLYVHNRVNSNNDGFHFISAHYVTVSNCIVICGDDACALFGSCQFVTVTNSIFSTRWSVFRFGGGQVKNVAVSNCVIYETYGCPIKIGAGHMQLENLSFANLVLQDVTGPIGIYFSGKAYGGEAAFTPFVRNISFSNIRATVVDQPRLAYGDMPSIGHAFPGEQHSCITLDGVNGHRVEDIRFSDVHVTYAGGGSAELAAKRVIPETVPRYAGEYFGVWSTAPFGPPAYGLYARNVKGLTLANVRFDVATPDLRPAMVFDHVQDAAINGFSAQGNPAAESLLRFSATEDVLITAARVRGSAAAFLQIEGPASTGITIDGGDLSKAAQPIRVRDGASEAAVRVRG